MGLGKILNSNSDSTRCGVGPFQLPSWFPFEEACAEHDAMYMFWRERFLQQTLDDDLESRVRKKIELWGMQRKLQAADDEFEVALNEDIDTHGGVRRLIYIATAHVFMVLVRTLGYTIWVENTMTEWRKRRGD